MFKGSIVALVTPFDDQGNVDYATFAELIEWHVESSTDAIAVCGVTGESPTLSYEEKVKIFRESVRVANGRIPIIAGTGSCQTAEALCLTEEAKNAGVDGALVITPYFNRPTPEGCYQHFRKISNIGLPMICYHHPSRAGIKLPVKALARILELPSIVAVKEGSTDLDYGIELMQLSHKPVLAGDDSLILPMMASGAVGVISIVANIIPREWKILANLLLDDEVGRARDYFRRYHALVMSMVLEINPQCVKYALSLMGKCLPGLRLPLTLPQETTQQKIEYELSKMNLNKHQATLV